MRGGLERWKRGVESRGVRQAIAYALEGVCDAHVVHSPGIDELEEYSGTADASVTRFVVEHGAIRSDELSSGALRVWLSGHDPVTGEERGKTLLRSDSDLLLDGTLNHPKSYSIAAMLHPEVAAEFEALQGRIRDRVITLWQRELNARRGHGGSIRESIAQLEVVELQHRRSRALDPHIHRHLWLNIKVRGEDGKWSNVDSRVAMKFHTVVNAEGELAARTDPQWIAALARHGYTIGEDGEIAELSRAVAPFSRRSAQIEANRVQLIAEWTRAHGGVRPSVEVLQQIDRRAWAMSRPNKPALVDELAWEAAVRDELAAIDPVLTEERAQCQPPHVPAEDLDLDLLAHAAVVEADDRSRASSGRFSQFDLRAGAIRALAGTGVIAEREALESIVETIAARARSLYVRLSSEPDIPGHVKAFMATDTMRLKMRVGRRLEAMAVPGRSLLPDELRRGASSVDDLKRLDGAQSAAACAIAGTHGLVAVTGPAGAGKTAMLRAAHAALMGQRRRMLVVAPTRKAASVAGRETGADASSLHALLHDHGYRWSRDETGAQVWQRLAPGDVDPVTGQTYRGPQRFPLDARDRIVVDEAGMVDLQAADALTEVALETGAGMAMVGDTHQALPVGHAGAMASAIRHASAAIEMDTVHRFHDAEYAALTLQLRDPRDHDHARQIAADLSARGHVRRVDSTEDARAAMVSAYFDATGHGRRVALVCGSNSEADAINAQIQQHRVDAGELDSTRLAWGRDEQRLLVGDAVQTRRNDPRTGVENRAHWIIARIDPDTIDLVSPTDSGERRRITRDYALDHVMLAYASTVHGIQGETTDAAIVGPDVDAAGLYVGLTRGRHHNEAIAIGRSDAAVREHLADTMLRGTTEVTINDSARAVAAELRRAARSQAAQPGAPFAYGSDTRGISL
ncbi:AAA family ATPase [Microbacterium sp. M3]|uniref:AAA family ATPase n=1 Tax=Microbacterium arthrosphaerae TaxID=792652 RepID=A0ABU4H3L8_9MICO|nr:MULTISPECIES: AAA family ATPase [Microbacterium]MDW4573254.1 AAA family ATPase [Microbacterium arthrosphaerae]MDW7607109.1 AAA family ATPase [Microbacterium sp. M3]